MTSITWSLIFASVTLTATAQLLLKVGMNRIGHFDFTAGNVFPIICKVLSNLPIMGGIFIYVASLVMWLMVLSRAEVSFAYPLVSIAYILNAAAACYFLNEQLSVIRIAGIFAIMAGVVLISRS
jgi:multidrug transporter EmrE-like cation transporter